MEDVEDGEDVWDRKVLLITSFVGRGFNRDIQSVRAVGFSP